MIKDLLWLSHELGREERGLAMLGEGNTSVRVDGETFWVKASGSSLGTLTEDGISQCRADGLIPHFDSTLTDAEIDATLFASRVDESAKKPSVEALFHAYLLSLPDVHFVGHTHPVAVNQLLCSPHARDFAEKRLFPDQIVCCGEASVLVPYTDPGLALARAIRDATNAFIEERGEAPRTILLENHGLIAIGRTPQAVLAATLMSEKSARIFVGAAGIGGPKFFSDAEVRRISGRPDEHYRRTALNL